jgi:hypothetical protein
MVTREQPPEGTAPIRVGINGAALLINRAILASLPREFALDESWRNPKAFERDCTRARPNALRKIGNVPMGRPIVLPVVNANRQD